MEVTEVRIGNYVMGQDNFPIHRVSGIEGNLIKTQPLKLISWESNEDGHSSARPLVITEDILNKLGFQSNGQDEGVFLSRNNFFRKISKRTLYSLSH